MNILHLSDIHFGRDNPAYDIKDKFENKNQILNDLLISICENVIKPNHILVTGDIAWFGKKSEFDAAIIWFRELLTKTNLTGNDITFCPGNHDINRAYGNYQTDLTSEKIEEIDTAYDYKTIHRMESPLYNYEKFCEALKVTPYHYPKNDIWQSSYSIGYKDISSPAGEQFRLISFNTALLSYIKHYPDDKMFIGQPQVIELLKQGLIKEQRDCYTITLFHHAERYLHPNEICEYDHRQATLPLLKRYVDLILCGHTETGGIPILNKQMGGAQTLTGGAAYYSDDHANSYSLIIIPDEWPKNSERGLCLLPFTYSSKKGWHQNERKNMDFKCETIPLKRPEIECRANFELLLTSNGQQMSIPLKYVSISMLPNNKASISNKDDVCRNLDILCTGPTDKPGTSEFSINIAETKENSIEALLLRKQVFKFIEQSTKSKKPLTIKLIDDKKHVFLSGSHIESSFKADDDGIDFLKKLRKIETKYDVLLKCPNNAQVNKVDVMNELIDFGYTSKFKAIPKLETFSSDKRQLIKLGIHSLIKKPLYILHEGNFFCNLYGNDFSIGNATVLMGPYSIKGIVTLLKGITSFKGDQRRIELNICKKDVCYFVTDKEKLKNDSSLKIKGSFIEVKTMECAWDFIYENSK